MTYASQIDDEFGSAWIPLAAKVKDVLRFLERRSSEKAADALLDEDVSAAVRASSGGVLSEQAARSAGREAAAELEKVAAVALGSGDVVTTAAIRAEGNSTESERT